MDNQVTETEMAIQNIEKQALAAYTNGNLHAFTKYWNHEKVRECGHLPTYRAIAVLAGARGKRETNGRYHLPGVREAVYTIYQSDVLKAKEIADLYGTSEQQIYTWISSAKAAISGKTAKTYKPKAAIQPVSQLPAETTKQVASWKDGVDHSLGRIEAALAHADGKTADIKSMALNLAYMLAASMAVSLATMLVVVFR